MVKDLLEALSRGSGFGGNVGVGGVDELVVVAVAVLAAVVEAFVVGVFVDFKEPAGVAEDAAVIEVGVDPFAVAGGFAVEYGEEAVTVEGDVGG